MFLESSGDGGGEARVGVDAVDALDEEGIVALYLVAGPSANLDNLAVGLADQGGNDGGVLVGDEAFSWRVSGRGGGLEKQDTYRCRRAIVCQRCGGFDADETGRQCHLDGGALGRPGRGLLGVSTL